MVRFSDMLLLIANRPVPSTWLKSTATASEVWMESQLLYDSWKLRPVEQVGGIDVAVEERAADEEHEDSSVLLVDLVEVALSLMREVSSLGKQVAQHNRTARYSK